MRKLNPKRLLAVLSPIIILGVLWYPGILLMKYPEAHSDYGIQTIAFGITGSLCIITGSLCIIIGIYFGVFIIWALVDTVIQLYQWVFPEDKSHKG